MTRTRAIGLAGIAVLVCVALIETATHSDPVLPATVAAITSTPASADRDNWHLDVTLPDGTQARIDLHGISPNRTIGDPLCVIEKKRRWTSARYLLTSQTTC